MTASPHHRLEVKGMTCQHCVKAVTQAIQAQDAQAGVVIDLAAGVVEVSTALPLSTIVQAIQDEGYVIAS